MNLSLILKLQILYSNMLTMLTILLQNLLHFYSTSEAQATHMSKRTHISRRAIAELNSHWCLNFPDFHLVSQKIGSGSIQSWLSWWLKGGRSWERVGSIDCFIDPLLSKWRQRENIGPPSTNHWSISTSEQSQLLLWTRLLGLRRGLKA